MANTLYDQGLRLIIDESLSDSINWESGTPNVGCSLHKSTYSFSKAHATMGSVTNEEAGASYTGNTATNHVADGRLGIPAAQRSVVLSSNIVALKISDGQVKWTTLSSVNNDLQLILFHAVTSAAKTNDGTSVPFARFDTGPGFLIAPSGGDVTINFSSQNVVTFTAPAG
jgi:hypothetical protein